MQTDVNYVSLVEVFCLCPKLTLLGTSQTADPRSRNQPCSVNWHV